MASATAEAASSGTDSAVSQAIRGLASSDPDTVVKALNFFLHKSYELVDANSIHLERYPSMMLSLGALLDLCNPICCPHFCNALDAALAAEGDIVRTLFKNLDPNFETIARSIDDNRFLLTILTILRNLSFEGANEQPIAQSGNFLKHITSIVIATLATDTLFEATKIAYDILVNIAARIDFVGKKRQNLRDWTFEDTLSYGKRTKDLLRLHLSPHLSISQADAYEDTALILMETIGYTIQPWYANQKNLSYCTGRSLELLGKLCSNADNVAVMQDHIERFVPSLTRILCRACLVPPVEPSPTSKSKSGASSSTNNGTTAAAEADAPDRSVYYRDTSSLNATFDWVAGKPPSFAPSSVELRDLTLDAMHSLCGISPSVMHQFASEASFVEMLYRAAMFPCGQLPITATGNLQAPAGCARAANLLGMVLAAQSHFAEQCSSIRSELLLRAMIDDATADIVCNKAVLYSAESMHPSVSIPVPMPPSSVPMEYS